MKNTETNENEGLLVRRIQNGTVIDHIDGGEALNVVKILGITGTTQEALSIATNVPSMNMGCKDQKKKLTGSLSSHHGQPLILSGIIKSVKKKELRSRHLLSDSSVARIPGAFPTPMNRS
jgi:hypothetical protein